MTLEHAETANPVMPVLLRHARGSYASAMRHALNQAGYDDIPGNGLYVIGGLANANADISLGQLILELGVSKQAAGQLVDTLVLRGYLDRAVDDTDRRKLNVTLTPRGHAAASTQAAARAKLDDALLDKVGADAIASTRLTLAALIDLGHG